MTHWRTLFGSATIAAAALGLAGPALAQIDTHSKAPIDITADRAEVVNAKCEAVWRGSAEALQEQTRLRAETITVFAKIKGTASNGQPDCGGAERIEADGDVYYVTPERNARGDRAVYTADTNQIVITGDVVIVQGDDVARGDKLTIITSTHEAVLESNATGAGKPGRVRGVFYPDKTKDADKTAAAAAPAKP